MKTIQSKLAALVGAFIVLGLLNLVVSLMSGQRAAGVVINYAGAQRMLSQRASKAALDLLRKPGDPLPRAELRGAKDKFETVLTDLQKGNSNKGILQTSDDALLAQLGRVRGQWEPFKADLDTILKNDVRVADARVAVEGVLAISVELLDSSNEVVGRFGKDRVATARLDMAGRQRMLSQRLSMNALALYHTPGNEALREKISADLDEFESSHATLKQERRATTATKKLLNEVDLVWGKFKGKINEVLEADQHQLLVYEAVERVGLANVKLLQDMDRAVTMYEEDNASRAAVLSSINVGIVLAVILVGILGWVTVVNPTVQTLMHVIQTTAKGAQHISETAAQVLASSDQLSGAATEQAAHVEEASSSMEEMAAMTRQNADHALSANETATNSQRDVSEGGDHVRNVSAAMSEINRSSEEIRGIMNKIQEIAFQTNLLAVNAAVEAAGAGAYGKRFAMVADEVRTLSELSATAATETEELIRSTLDSVRRGTNTVRSLEESFSNVEQGSSKVVRLVAEIRSASGEQARGIDEVNQMIIQLDQASQRNSSAAQETSAAANQLNDQAAELQLAVLDLLTLVDSSAGAARMLGRRGGAAVEQAPLPMPAPARPAMPRPVKLAAMPMPLPALPVPAKAAAPVKVAAAPAPAKAAAPAPQPQAPAGGQDHSEDAGGFIRF